MAIQAVGVGVDLSYVLYLRCGVKTSQHTAADTKNQSKPLPDFPLSAQVFSLQIKAAGLTPAHVTPSHQFDRTGHWLHQGRMETIEAIKVGKNDQDFVNKPKVK